MKGYLQQQRIAVLYHFTDIDNLPLILQAGGLRSKKWLERNSMLDRVKTGGNQLSKDLDLRRGNWDKVSLSFCHGTPMAYRRETEQHLCYAVIKLDVVLREGVQFTDRNATDSNHQRGEGLQGLNLVDFSAIRASFPYKDGEEKKRKQNVWTINPHDQRVFRVRGNWRLTLLVNAYVITGANWVIRWSDSAGATFYEDKDTVSQSAMFAWWPSLDASQLSPGSYEVSCYLGDVRQFTLPFQVVS